VPIQRAPGDVIFGFRDDGTFGEKPAACLFLESVAAGWPPGDRIWLEGSVTVPGPGLLVHVRSWAVWKNPDGSQATNGDPDWGNGEVRDQQGIPTYVVSMGLPARG
jgi:hypothetical protein